MCGIFGVFEFARRAGPDDAMLQQTAASLRSRGPDAAGFHSADGIGLVHTRLALVDLDRRSDQPFWDRSSRFALVYNGELYDYGDLRDELIRRGTEFRTESDTEVLLEALVQLGVWKTLERVDGMFAFGLYDSHAHRLWLARDRMGIKPCYVARSSDRLLFASNVQALAHWMPLRPDKFTVGAFLQGAAGPTLGRTFFEQIEQLPPGTILDVTADARVQRRTFFRLSDLAAARSDEATARLSDRQWVDRLDEALVHSVQSQTATDAPMGALCSGGVDSSLILAIGLRHRPGLVPFHADVVGPQSERPAAERLARQLNVDLISVPVRDDDFVESMPEIIAQNGFPFTMHANSLPFFHVARRIRETGIKAVLCGEGADELFLGYPWLVPNFRAQLKILPRTAYQALARSAVSWERRLRGRGPSPRVSIGDQVLACGLMSGFERDLGPPTDRETEHRPAWARSVRSLSESGGLTFILRSLLHRNDSMGMAHGVETRFPMLSEHVMLLAARMPTRLKIRVSPGTWDWHHLFFREKWVLRQVARRYLPRDLSERKKIPFPAHAYRRLRIDRAFFAGSYVSELFGLNQARTNYLFDQASHGLQLRLLQLDLWGRIYFWQQSPASLVPTLRSFVRFGPKPPIPAPLDFARKAA